MTAYARIDDSPIRVRTHITTPDIVVVLDPGLPRSVDVVGGLEPHGLLLINSTEAPDRVCAGYRVMLVSTDEPPEWIECGFSGRIATVDATGIALAHGLGTRSTPIVNTAILGALACASRIVTIDSILEAIRLHVPAKPQANMEAAREAYDRVRLLEEVVA